MKHLYLISLLLVIALVNGQPCPLSYPDTGYKTGQATFCSQYASQSCCSSEEDSTLQTQWETKVVPQFGSDGCGQNIKDLFCAWTCGPDQAIIANVAPSNVNVSILNASIFSSPEWASTFYDSCYDRCIPVAGGILVGSYFATPEALLAIFDGQNDATYVPDVGAPYLYYFVGNSTQGYNWNGLNDDGVALPASGNDTTGCTTAKGDGVRSVELFLSITNLILAVFALSFLY